MAGNTHTQQPDGLADDFFEQILAVPSDTTAFGGGGSGGSDEGAAMGLQLGSGSGHGSGFHGMGMGMGIGMPLGLNLEHGGFQDVDRNNDVSSSSITGSGMNERDSVHLTSFFPAFGHLQTQSVRPPAPTPTQLLQPYHSQPMSGMVAAAQHPSAMRPRVRARRGQATDPHSIAERLRRERIAERMRALQELVPVASKVVASLYATFLKTDRAAMLDEIVDYVKFLRLQVKVLSMSRLGGAGAVAQLVADVPLEGEGMEGGPNQPAWEKWSNDGTEQQVAKLMEEDIGAAMQFLQSKALCIMPISLASAIFPDASIMVKPESNGPS